MNGLSSNASTNHHETPAISPHADDSASNAGVFDTSSVDDFINDAGEIAGYSWIVGNGSTHAFVVLNGVMVDLNSLLTPADSGWVITAAYGINDQGQIVGEGLYQGQSYAILLNDPPPLPAGSESSGSGSSVPEPGTWILAGGALLLGALRHKLSRRR